MSKVKISKLDGMAHVEMGEWDGEYFALDGDYPVGQLSDGTYVVILGTEEPPDEPEDSPDRRVYVKRRRQ